MFYIVTLKHTRAKCGIVRKTYAEYIPTVDARYLDKRFKNYFTGYGEVQWWTTQDGDITGYCDKSPDYRVDFTFHEVKTDEDWCKFYRLLDQMYGTTKGSPLHHDNRCKIHKRTS